jgi:hypothetical protein
MATDTQIVNSALRRIGVDKPIASLTENTKAGVLANASFAEERDYVLRDFPWPFATAFATLALVSSESTAYNDRWFYAYRYPAGVLFLRGIVTAVHPDPAPVAYAIARDSQGKLILANEVGPVVVEYTYAVTDPGEFDPMFCSMLAWKLGSVMAPALSRIEKMAETCIRMYEIEKTKAQSRAANEEQRPAPTEASWIEGR